MAYIGREPQIGNFQICDAISVVDAQAAYTMQVSSVDVSPESANHMIVSLNGVIQKPTDAYTVSGSTITFASNLVTGDVIDFIQILGNVLDLGVPSDATVTTAKIVDGAVTSAKITYPLTTFSSTGIDDNATSTAITIDSSQNVGVGETSPLGKLHVKSADSGVTTPDAGADDLIIESSTDTGMSFLSTDTATIRFNDANGTGDASYQYRHDDRSTRIVSAGSERMRITSGGQILMRTSSTSLTNATQVVFHPGSSEHGIRINSTNTSGTQYHLSFDRGETQAGYITSNSATTIAVNNASDERLKENIQNSGSAIEDLKNIQVRQFDWKDGIDTHRDFGFVAQELVNVVPEAVTQGTDELNENGKPVQSWGVDYSHIVPRLVKVCQEQQTKIEELEARITALENA